MGSEDGEKEEFKFTEFKRYLLRSGIPLEGSVSQKIQNFDLIDNGEYFYERDGKIFSIDIYAMTFLDFEIYYRSNLVELDILIECKYHEPDKKWVFMTFEQSEDFSFRVHTYNIFIDFPMEKRLTEYGYHQKYHKRRYENHHSDTFSKYFPDNLRKVHKGIEIYKKGFNPNSISQTLFQLLFGVGAVVVENIKDLYENPEEEIRDGDDYIYLGGNLGSFILPIIVTSAELYVLNPAITVEDIKASKHLDQIAEKVKAVFYEQSSQLELEKFIKESLSFREEMLKSEFFSSENIDDQIDDFSSIEPRILIINYDSFDEVMESLLEEVNSHFRELSKFWSKKRK